MIIEILLLVSKCQSITDSVMGDDDMVIDDGPSSVILSKELEMQISKAIDPRFLLQLVCS